MKKYFFLFLLIPILTLQVKAQKSNWETPKFYIPLVSEGEEIANLGVEKSLRYADLELDNSQYRILFNPSTAKCTIIDLEAGNVLAEGKRLNSWRDAVLTFNDGAEYRFEKLKKKEGYEIIGPNGQLLNVENRGFKPVSVEGKKEIVSQSVFVFKRIIELYEIEPTVINDYTTYYPTKSN